MHTLNWAAWVLIVLTFLEALLALVRIATGRKELKPAETVGLAVVQVLVVLAVTWGNLWLILLATGVWPL